MPGMTCFPVASMTLAPAGADIRPHLDDLARSDQDAAIVDRRAARRVNRPATNEDDVALGAKWQRHRDCRENGRQQAWCSGHRDSVWQD
jgi:hypothetical protein